MLGAGGRRPRLEPPKGSRLRSLGGRLATRAGRGGAGKLRLAGHVARRHSPSGVSGGDAPGGLQAGSRRRRAPVLEPLTGSANFRRAYTRALAAAFAWLGSGCRVGGAGTEAGKPRLRGRGARLSGAWRRDPRLESLGYEERREVVGCVAQGPEAGKPRLRGEARGCRVRGAGTRAWKASATRRGARLSGGWRRNRGWKASATRRGATTGRGRLRSRAKMASSKRLLASGRTYGEQPPAAVDPLQLVVTALGERSAAAEHHVAHC